MEREAVGRDSCPTAGVIDSQSVKTSENTSISGYDVGKKIKGHKRHIMVIPAAICWRSVFIPPTFRIVTGP